MVIFFSLRIINTSTQAPTFRQRTDMQNHNSISNTQHSASTRDSTTKFVFRDKNRRGPIFLPGLERHEIVQNDRKES
jgi:hypothetical protein